MTIPQTKAWLIVALSLGITAFISPKNSIIIRPGPDAGFYPIPKVPVQKFITKAGLVLYTPEKGDQCWDSQLTCVPYPDSNLRLIAPGDFAKGFAISK